MKRIKFAALVLGFVISQSAFASAIFSWKTTSYSPTIASIEGMIEITDAAAQSGVRTDYSMPGGCSFAGCTDPLSPILSFHFAVNGQAMDLFSTEAGLKFFRDSIFSANFLVEGDRLDLRLYFNNSESDVSLSDSVAFNTDRPGPCSTTGVCRGATGEFVRIPEPGSMLLVALGLALAVHRRAKHVATLKTVKVRAA